MDILKKLIITLSPVLLTAGCYSDFNPDYYSEPVLCVNSVITAGDTVKISISHTWRYDQPSDGEDVLDAEVDIYVNGQLQSSPYVANEGDEIRIVAHSIKYGDADATVKVPNSVSIGNVDINPTRMNAGINQYDDGYFAAWVDGDMTIRIPIICGNPSPNFFRLGYDSYHPEWIEDEDPDDSEEGWHYGSMSYLDPGSLDYYSDQIFKEHMGIYESAMGGYQDLQLFFTDSMFADGTYTLTLKLEDFKFMAEAKDITESLYDCGITFRLMAISQSYYDRLNYIWQKNSSIIGDLSDLGMSDPVWGYSNVSSGAGVVAAKAVTTYNLNLKNFIKEAIEREITNKN